jgi:hypothetical protein
VRRNRSVGDPESRRGGSLAPGRKSRQRAKGTRLPPSWAGYRARRRLEDPWSTPPETPQTPPESAPTRTSGSLARSWWSSARGQLTRPSAPATGARRRTRRRPCRSSSNAWSVSRPATWIAPATSGRRVPLEADLAGSVVKHRRGADRRSVWSPRRSQVVAGGVRRPPAPGTCRHRARQWPSGWSAGTSIRRHRRRGLLRPLGAQPRPPGGWLRPRRAAWPAHRRPSSQWRRSSGAPGGAARARRVRGPVRLSLPSGSSWRRWSSPSRSPRTGAA